MKAKSGFTLIELSIVLVIIGLIVGGVLVGQDLISAAGIRGQIKQIENYNSAVNTFRGKYGYLPGDIPDPTATQFGFAGRGTAPGEGDGNGVIEGNNGQPPGNDPNCPCVQLAGETTLFWMDLTTAGGQNINLIEGGFNSGTYSVAAYNVTNSDIPKYFPQAKIGKGNFVYVYSGGAGGGDSANYFGISIVTSYLGLNNLFIANSPGLTVQEAYAIDRKIDDGLPQSGRVTAMYLNFGPPWGPPTSVHWASGVAGTDGANAGAPNYGPTNNATSGSATTCYDNNTSSGPMNYSMEFNNGANINCALSFRFQ
jgi:prepilin-type N-terminal cleavage/methylation domain-containing protein